ncbi:uncharacterized protein K489DRAFT_97348 [Dissoconium aciculare CBS 342.82]|uniref:Uncharacterized protein n=1 Tax=Dissoconium aciculare CBS 342.82 TaxID=1314786 RepID=A0A6J3LSW8_9PEZI|nr:uncharacterized protein K489DRAFT_97348 [Dissoconium aciculare CBS 342.82]KAF1818384.1 hypothetical protein K489DRAFT_97348 [Dissoconium aciculare CBS 342.82]
MGRKRSKVISQRVVAQGSLGFSGVAGLLSISLQCWRCFFLGFDSCCGRCGEIFLLVFCIFGSAIHTYHEGGEQKRESTLQRPFGSQETFLLLGIRGSGQGIGLVRRRRSSCLQWQHCTTLILYFANGKWDGTGMARSTIYYPLLCRFQFGQIFIPRYIWVQKRWQCRL